MSPVIDGHNDLLLRAVQDGDPLAVFGGAGYANGETADDAPRDADLSIPDMVEFGVSAGFFAVFVSTDDEHPEPTETAEGYRYAIPDAPDHDYARERTYEAFAALHRVAAAREDVVLVDSITALDACLGGDAVGLIPHVEGASGIAPDLSNLDFLYAAGLRSVGPLWSRPNQFGHGVPFERPGHPEADGRPGLTEAGEALVAACNERGVLVDAAHMNAAELDDALRVSADPLAVTHTAAHALVSHSRNLTDDQLHAVADAGGVVGVTYSASQLAADPQPGAAASYTDVADHVAYLVDELGAEHVALGSDFDGARLPGDMDGVRDLPALLDAVRERGVDGRDFDRVTHENWRDLLARVWR